MHANRAAAMLLTILAFGACSRAPDRQDIVGHYATRFTARDDVPWRGIVGDWEAEYRADRHLIVHHGSFNVEALYRLDGDILTITDLNGSASCRQDGVDIASARYRVHFIETGLGMRIEPLRDECDGRRFVRSSHTWQRIR
jgi:hypothetical protein